MFVEIIGTIAFAVSGAMVGIRNKMDIFGVAILGMTTAIGGGCIRDILLGQIPPLSLQHPLYAILGIAVSLLVFLPPVRKKVDPDSFDIIIADSLGLGAFVVAGVKTAMPYDNLFLEVFIGTITGVGGGVLRDIFAAEKPMIFVKHFYAMAAIIGALICAALFPYGEKLAMMTGAAVIIILRLCAAKFKWHLPKA